MRYLQVDYNKSVYRLFLLLFYIDLILGLCPAWSGSFVLKFISYDVFMKVWLFGGVLSLITLSFTILCLQRKVYNSSIFYNIYILHIFFAISIAVNGFKSGGLALIGIPVSYLAIFDTLKQYQFHQKHLKFAFVALLLWSILPIIYYAIAPVETKILFLTGPGGNLLTFGGFAQHRNFYGIFLGVTFICTLVWKMRKIYKVSLSILLIAGMILSVCRTAILSIAVTMVYVFLFHPKIRLKKKLLYLFILFLLGLALYNILTDPTLTARDVSDNDDRIELWGGMIDIIKDNFLFGLGKEALYFSKMFPEGAQAHNFILAAIASYGIFVFLSFAFLLILLFKYSNFYFRVFLVYLICWGISQPYFGLMLFSSHILIPLFLGHLMDNNEHLVY